MIWLAAFFSQTGTEIIELSNLLKLNPRTVITNVVDKTKINTALPSVAQFIIQLPPKPTENDYRSLLNGILQRHQLRADQALFTLHGWLRIVPEAICKEYTFLNGHPGLISDPDYGFLKGFNPQEKAFKAKMTHVGSVVHKVIPEVDDGEIISSDDIYLNEPAQSLDEMYGILRRTSLNAWKQAFRKVGIH